MTWLDSEIESSFAGLTPIGTPAQLQAETFEFTPEWAANAGFEYEWSLNPDKDMFVADRNVRHRVLCDT